MLRYAITSLGTQGFDSAEARWSHLKRRLERWVVDGIDVLQIREKQLETKELLELTTAAVGWLREHTAPAKPVVLLNGRPDVAFAAGAEGVHLSTQPGELTAAQVRAVFRIAGPAACTVSVSCHSLGEVARAREAGVDAILFGPVFEKRVRGELVAQGTGLLLLQAACTLAAPVPVLALGGVTAARAGACRDVGAGGIAGIRLFA